MNVARVKIWGAEVGAVAWDDASGYATFEYTPEFARRGWELAPLMMPVSRNRRRFSFPALRRRGADDLDAFRGLPGLLADALPDRYGMDLMNLWLVQQGRPMGSMNPVESLCFIGSRAMGALEFEPTTFRGQQQAFRVEVDALVAVAQRALQRKAEFSTNMREDAASALSDILHMGTSAGGARPKAVVAYNEQTGEVRSGQTSAPEGFSHYLLKLDGVSDMQLGASFGYGRVEMAYYKMASACGIRMMPSRLLEEHGRAHFMTQRFDREGGTTKHHVQTFCGIRHVDYNQVHSFSYEQLFATARELRLDYSDAEQLFRRMVFNVVARNCDDHTKNFAFMLRQGGRWELAPAYDVCHAYRPDSTWVSQHALSVNGKRQGIEREDLLVLAKTAGVKKARAIIDEVVAVVQQWPAFAEGQRVDVAKLEAIGRTLRLDLA